ncbi:Uncharacterised protein [Yersinia enterocolitica]|nr:Uncharacterised protein [Yersinia enterocolitica]
MHQQLTAKRFSRVVTEFIHFTEFPAGVHMQQWEWQVTGEECLARQMQHHRRVFTDGIEHHRVTEFGGHFTDDMDTLRLQLPQMSESFFVHNRSFMPNSRLTG